MQGLEDIASSIFEGLELDGLTETLVLEAIINEPTSILESVTSWPITHESATQHLINIEKELELPLGSLSQFDFRDSWSEAELGSVVGQRAFDLRSSMANI